MLPLGLSWGSSENALERRRKTACSAPIFPRMSQAKTPVVGDPEITPAISASPFSEDVSSETLIFSKMRLRR